MRGYENSVVGRTTLFFSWGLVALVGLAALVRLVRLVWLVTWARLFNECTSSVVGLAVADDEQLAIDEAFCHLGIILIDILYCSSICWRVMDFHRYLI